MILQALKDKQHAAFIECIRKLDLDRDEGIAAILKFMDKNPINVIEKNAYVEEIKETNPFIAFRLNTDIGLVSERKEIIEKILAAANKNDKKTVMCMITGEHDAMANLHPPIKGVYGTNTTGGNIVSFNLDVFNSFGKKQGENAPISEKATFAYTTALNYLLRKDSRQKIQIGDTTRIFWSDRQSVLENNFSILFNEPPRDNPDALTEAVEALYKSVETGAMPIEDKQTRFFVLGLSPNAARISVRFWQIGTIAEFSQKIAQHFHDLEVEHAPYQKNYLPMWQMLKSIAVREDVKNIPPSLAGDWMRAILMGLPYPDALYQAVLRRIHAEKEVSYPRAAIIKAYLNRRAIFEHQPEKEIIMSLDKDNQNIGYRLGRLFATLEKIQSKAQPSINATIRDRYYSSVSRTPASVLPTLLRLKNHHLGKINKGSAIYFERLIGEILGNKVMDFPSQLNLQDQGRFAIGYYHQREAFFNKSEINTTT